MRDLPNDYARCNGKRRIPKDGEWPFPAMEQECWKCLRRTSRPEGAIQLSYFAPPAQKPCPQRIGEDE